MFFARLLLLSICLMGFASGQTRLPADEVESLKVIGRSLGKTWNFSVDPCSGLSGWATQNPDKGFENAVNCSCTYDNNSTCHVVSIEIQASGLAGPIPSAIASLTNLTDLRISDLNGNESTFPPDLSNIRNLETLILRSCNIVGELPKYLGGMTGLKT
ncbi:UNVERIFIED_CONTAM: hypothetical protein Slati_2085600, partial [Sesamum latifolium]